MPKPLAPEEAMSQYKTIALELIREQPELYERLRSSKRLNGCRRGVISAQSC